MKISIASILLLLFVSCQSPASDTAQLEQRVTELERRINQLEGSSHKSYETSVPLRSKAVSTRHMQKTSNRCQAITKKGAQCKRSAKGGDYCWQHG